MMLTLSRRYAAVALLLFAVSLLFTAPSSADAYPSANEVHAQKQRVEVLQQLLELERAQLDRMIQQQRATTSPASAEPFYAPIAHIRPGQLRYSEMNVQDKVSKAKDKGLAYDQRRSILPLTSALPVIDSPYGYVLVDGHHDLLASRRLHATTVPIKIVANFRQLTPDAFWREAEARGYIYPYAIGGRFERPPRSFDELVDDPNRYFAAISARKCEREGQDAGSTSGAEYPLWIKIGKDIPFIEFKISDKLFAHKFRYANEEQVTDALVEKARAILHRDPIEGLRLVPEKTRYSQISNLCSPAS